jgi:acetoin utilization deacetylase AcuC-like enzyme
MVTQQTGYVFDPVFLKHDYEGHPESAKRLKAITAKLDSSGVISKLKKINSRPASVEEISICHSADYIKNVERVCGKGGGHLDADTYTNSYSYEAAITAVGSLIDLTKSVIDGEIKNGFAFLRPPGHHALADRAMGFCIFGNVAVAAKTALKHSSIKKAAIVDFDVHHGNGTQALIENNPDILFISTHQFPFYPGTGAINETGSGDAEGNLINIPLAPNNSDNNYKLIYDEIVIPALKRFKPEIVFVSAGYDAHWNDPLANMGLSLTGYSYLSVLLVKTADELCGGKIIFSLEGGYNLQVLENGVLNSVKALMGKTDFEDPLGQSPNKEPDVSKLISELKRIHSL